MNRATMILFLRATILCFGLTGVMASVQAQTQEPAAERPTPPPGFRRAPPPPKPVAEEYLLLGNETRGSGEAELAVDPTNPDNIVATGMGTWQMIPGCEAPEVNCKDFHNFPNSTHPVSASTSDGGRTWKHFILPIIDQGDDYKDRTRCPDPFAGSTKDGVLLVGCEPRETDPDRYDPPGGTALVVSTDGGRTWSKRVEGISDYTGPNFPKFAPGLKPRHAAHSPWDRPWLTFDDRTGAVYLYSSGGQTNIDTGHPDTYRTQSYFTVSHDKGMSFGTINALDTLEWPQSGRADIAAGLGSLAEIYVAREVPDSENATCPCQVWGISFDEGKTFDRHVMENVTIAQGAATGFGPRGGNGSLGKVIADPTTEGRFSVMRYMPEPAPHHEFSTTNDNGKTWSDWTSVSSVPGAEGYIKHATKYSRWGVIGLVWKAVYPGGSFELWSAISRDAGRTFSEPLKVSSARSQPRNYYRQSMNDDTDSIDMSQDHLYTLWGDTRAGFQASWFGKVALSSYQFGE